MIGPCTTYAICTATAVCESSFLLYKGVPIPVFRSQRPSTSSFLIYRWKYKTDLCPNLFLFVSTFKLDVHVGTLIVPMYLICRTIQ